jgi:two-component system, LytTR family, response regulator
MKLTCVTIDDEPLNLKNLEILLGNYFEQIHILNQFQNVKEAVEFLCSTKVDFVFLDISMPFEDGFDLLAQFPNREFEVVFVTAYEEYAIKAIKEGALDYILKPILLEELQEAIQRVSIRIAQKKQFAPTEKITLSHSNGKTLVDMESIVYIQGIDNISRVVLEDGRKIMVSKTLKHFEQLLDIRFFRIHKSYIANLNKSTGIVNEETHFLVLENNDKLPVSRRCYKAFIDTFQNNKK